VTLVVLEFEVWNTFPNYERSCKVSAVVYVTFKFYSSVTLHIVVVIVGTVLAVTCDLIFKKKFDSIRLFLILSPHFSRKKT